MKKLAEKLAYMTAALTLALVVAAASFNGYFDKWLFLDSAPYSLRAHFDDVAARPQAYRRLLIDMANAAHAYTPEAVKFRVDDVVDRSTRVVEQRYDSGHSRAHYERWKRDHTGYEFRFVSVYLLVFASFVGMFFATYFLAREAKAQPLAAAGGAACLVLLFPLLQSKGGYYYDAPETLLFCLFLLAAARANALLLLLVAAIGAWNKESFFFFVPVAWPLLRPAFGRLRATALVALCMLVSGAIYLWMRTRFGMNDGQSFEFHLFDQLSSLRLDRIFMQSEITYGMLLPHPLSFPFVLSLAYALWLSWPALPRAFRLSFLVAIMINAPLYLALGFPGEVRGLSMTFPLLTVVIALALERSMTGARGLFQPPERSISAQ